MNKRKSYSLVDSETGKVIKHRGKLQYFRLWQTALQERIKLQAKLGKRIEIKELNINDIKNEKIQI